MRGRLVAAVLALAIAGCGGSGGGTSSTGATGTASPSGVLRAWYLAAARGNGATACGLMTGHGRRAVEAVRESNGQSCRNVIADHRFGRPRPERVGPVGTHDSVALGVVQFQAHGSRAVGVLRRQGGRWLVDLAGPVPVLDSVRANGVPDAYRESLPIAGPDVLGVAGRWVDGHVASGSLNRVHVAAAAVVGGIALAYLVPGSDVGGAAKAPPATRLEFLLLVESDGRWRVVGLV
jgi:hypothetical protein